MAEFMYKDLAYIANAVYGPNYGENNYLVYPLSKNTWEQLTLQ